MAIPVTRLNLGDRRVKTISGQLSGDAKTRMTRPLTFSLALSQSAMQDGPDRNPRPRG